MPASLNDNLPRARFKPGAKVSDVPIPMLLLRALAVGFLAGFDRVINKPEVRAPPCDSSAHAGCEKLTAAFILPMRCGLRVFGYAKAEHVSVIAARNKIPRAPGKHFRKVCGVRYTDNRRFRIAAHEPWREQYRCVCAFRRTRRHEYHEPVDIAAFQCFKPLDKQQVMRGRNEPEVKVINERYQTFLCQLDRLRRRQQFQLSRIPGLQVR